MTGFIIFAGAIVVYLIVVTVYLVKLRKHYNRLIAVSGKENLSHILDAVLDKLSANKQELDQLRKKIDALAKQGQNHIQKVGVFRFNPFSDTGGDQSFVLSLLDGMDNGLVLTSLHNRNLPRWYAKNVRYGEGQGFKLSDEEKKAVKISGQKEEVN